MSMFTDWIQKIKDWLAKQHPAPAPAPVPVPPPVPPTPPAPPAPPVPVGDEFKAVMWGDSYNGAEKFGCLDMAIRHGMSGEPQAFLRDCKGIRARGGNCYTYIADSVMVSHSELFMFLTNAKSPVDGHRMNDAENSVIIARKLGVTKWIVSIFNDQKTCVPSNGHEAWIQKLCGWYDWAGVNDVVLMVCLEADERFSVADAVQRVAWCKKYAPALRVVVGSAKSDYLKQVAAKAKALNLAVELAPETPWDPTKYNLINWPAYQGIITDLKNTGCPVWWGEALEPDMTKAAQLTAWAKSAGVAGYLFGRS